MVGKPTVLCAKGHQTYSPRFRKWGERKDRCLPTWCYCDECDKFFRRDSLLPGSFTEEEITIEVEVPQETGQGTRETGREDR